jgi:hypothetical protein
MGESFRALLLWQLSLLLLMLQVFRVFFSLLIVARLPLLWLLSQGTVRCNNRGPVNGSVQVACVRVGSYVMIWLSSLGLGL